MIWWVVFFFLAGMALILAEFIVPGGICGLAGVILVVLSGGIGVHVYPEYAVVILCGEGAGAVASVALGMLLLSRTRAAKRLILETSQRAEDGFTNAESDLSLVGRAGVVLTALRPAGTIEIGNRRLDAVSSGAFIDKGAAIRVIEVHGNRVVVESAG